MIDFDTASPGSRVWDLACLAYRMVPLTSGDNPEVPASSDRAKADRLTRLCFAYGHGLNPEMVMSAAAERLADLVQFTTARVESGGPAQLAEHVTLYLRDLDYLRVLRRPPSRGPPFPISAF